MNNLVSNKNNILVFNTYNKKINFLKQHEKNLIQAKVYTKDELKDLLNYQIKPEAIEFTKKYLNLNNENIIVKKIEELIYLNDSKLKEELLELKYIKQDQINLNFLLAKTIYYIDVMKDEKVELINKYIDNYECINKKEENTHIDVYEFIYYETEIEFVANQICSLITKNISVNEINIVVNDVRYQNMIPIIFENFNLKIKKEYVLKNKKIIKPGIEIVSSENINPSKYNFVLGVNNKFILKYQTNLYLTKKEKEKQKIISDVKINQNKKELIKKELLFNANATFTYSKKVKNDEYKIIDIGNVKQAEISKTCFSIEYDLNKLAKSEEKYAKYYQVDDNYYLLSDLKNHLQYQKFDNNIKFNTSKNKITDITLSASSLENFYSCEYKFYLYNVLRLKLKDLKKDTWHLEVGTYIHYLLEEVLKNKIDPTLNNLNGLKEKFITDSYKKFDELELFYLNKITSDVLDIVNEIRVQDKNIDAQEVKYEEKIEFILNEELNIKMIGFIDKLMKKENEFIVIDYKTGDANLNFDYLKSGLFMQNMVYYYLMVNGESENKMIGTYRQYIKSRLKKYDDDKNYYLLNGFTVKEEIGFIGEIDKLQGISYKKDGDLKKSNKLVNQDYFEDNLQTVKDNIKNVVDHLKYEEIFSINPKKIVSKYDSCDLCDYQSICYKTNASYKYVKGD